MFTLISTIPFQVIVVQKGWRGGGGTFWEKDMLYRSSPKLQNFMSQFRARVFLCRVNLFWFEDSVPNWFQKLGFIERKKRRKKEQGLGGRVYYVDLYVFNRML